VLHSFCQGTVVHRDLKPRFVHLHSEHLAFLSLCAYLHVTLYLVIDFHGLVYHLVFANDIEGYLYLLRNVLLVNSSADHLKVGDFGLSKLIRVKNSHDVYKMTGETGDWELYV
jgi:serine/threonine protein kinase